MFSKHVWNDTDHRAEIFISDEGTVLGAIVTYQGAVCLVNPRSEILTALYNEGKINRLLSITTVIMTDNTIDYTRGLCGFINYCRALRRSNPLTIFTRNDTNLSTEALNSFCSRFYGDTFDIVITPLKPGKKAEVGKGSLRFVRPTTSDNSANPYLVIQSTDRTLFYFDETHTGPFENSKSHDKSKPDVIIRAAELLAKMRAATL